MAVSELKKIIELENIELEGTLSNLEKQKAGYVVNQKGAVKKVDIEGQKWNRASGLSVMIFAEVFMIIMIFWAIFTSYSSTRIFNICFAAIFFALFLITLIMGQIAETKWNRNYRELCLKIEETKTKIKTNKKKLEVLNEENE